MTWAQHAGLDADAPFYAGIDGGASNCRVALAHVDKGVIATANKGPANIFLDPVKTRDHMLHAVDQVCHEAGLDLDMRANLRIVAGLAGAESPHARHRFFSLLFPYQNLQVVPDTSIALFGAFDGDPGGIVIVGTGVAGEWRASADAGRVGGWGLHLNDRGSGAWIGRRALQIYVNTLDGLLPPNALAKAVAPHFPDGRAQILEFAYTAKAGDFGKFAKVVWAHADAGDTLATQVIQKAADTVGGLLAAMARQGAPRLSLLGGMADKLQPRLKGDYSRLLVPAKMSALEGAVAMARDGVIEPWQDMSA